MGYKDHPGYKDPVVFLDLQVGQVLQAIPVHLDHSALLETQVIISRRSILDYRDLISKFHQNCIIQLFVVTVPSVKQQVMRFVWYSGILCFCLGSSV